MKTFRGKPVAAALLWLLAAGCASTPPVAARPHRRYFRGASYDLPTARGGWPDAYGHPRGPAERGFVTGSLIPETPAEQRNDPNRLGSLRVFDRDDLLRRGGGLSVGDSLGRLDLGVGGL